MITIKAVDGTGEHENRGSREEAHRLASLLAKEHKKEYGLYPEFSQEKPIETVNHLSWDSLLDPVEDDPAIDYLRASMRINNKPSKIEILENLAVLEGEESNIVPSRYLWHGGKDNTFHIYVDVDHRFMLVHDYGKLVCSTVDTGLVFIPGDWWQIIEPHVDRISNMILDGERQRNKTLAKEQIYGDGFEPLMEVS